MIGAICITIAATYVYIFKEPLKHYEKIKEEHNLLKTNARTGADPASAITSLEKQIHSMKLGLRGEVPMNSISQMVTHIIAILDAISNEHGIHLQSMKPEIPQQIKMFEEIPFSVKVSGKYLHIHSWLQRAEEELGAMVVKTFHMQPNGDSGAVTMELQVAAFRPLEELP